MKLPEQTTKGSIQITTVFVLKDQRWRALLV